ncbi:hypothetical protein GCM10010485_82230 [Streptosporangium carneum]
MVRMGIADMCRPAEPRRRGPETSAERRRTPEARRERVRTRITQITRLTEDLGVLDHRIDFYKALEHQ